MPRPRKCRRVCGLPQSNIFGPLCESCNDKNTTFMTVDEYETIRLMDMESMTQEQCAEQMEVARTTVQRIYYDARKKIATALVKGQFLKIQGGDFRVFSKSHLCDGVKCPCKCRCKCE